MQIMCDWVTGSIQTPLRWFDDHPVWDSGKAHILEPGAVFPSRVFPRRAMAEGSYSTRFSWMSRTGYDFELSGNPVKFLQGHNLFGSPDARGLFFETGYQLRRLGVPFPSPESYSSYGCALKLTRLDLTRSYRFSSDESARAWLQMVGAFSRSRAGGAVMREGTLYFGDGSSYWSLKVYLKSDEVRSRRRGHGLPLALSQESAEQLLEWSRGVVRFEVTLRSRLLAGMPGEIDAAAVWSRYFGRVDFMGMSSVSDDFLSDPRISGLPSGCRLALAAWASGDQRALQGVERTTMFRYRKAIREIFDVDIAVPRPTTPTPAVDLALDPAGWDPEPIEALYHRVDPSLSAAYQNETNVKPPSDSW